MFGGRRGRELIAPASSAPPAAPTRVAADSSSPVTALELCTRHSDFSSLGAGVRVACPQCSRRCVFFCESCHIPLGVSLPAVRLPLRVEILRGKEETDARSTASALASLSPDVRIWRLPAFPPNVNPSRTLLLYPSPTSVPVSSIDVRDFDSLLVIDTTWGRAGGVLQLAELAQPFVHIHLGGVAGAVAPHTLFWRHQPLGPACVSTAEATYYALRGLEIARSRRERGDANAGAGIVESADVASSDGLYDGRYDDLLFLFLAQYHRVQKEYTDGRNAGKSFTTKMRSGYIKGAADGGSDACVSVDDAANGGDGVGGGAGGGAAPSKPVQVRKKPRVKGGWAVRMDYLDEKAASVKARSVEKFSTEHKESGGEAEYWKTVQKLHHAYGERVGGSGAGVPAAGTKEGGGSAPNGP